MTDLADNPAPSPRRLRAAGALVVIVVAVVGGAWGIYRLTAGRAVLAGARRHDFGIVQLDEPVTLEHAFALTNRGGRPVDIAEVRTTCGCTAATPSATTVEPGASVEIAATLTLKQEGRKDARIFVTYRDGDVDVLHLGASARLRRRLTAGPALADGKGGIEIPRPQDAAVLVIEVYYRDYDSNGEPPAPRVTAPQGTRAEFLGWERAAMRQRARELPARWRGRVAVERGADAPAGGPIAAIEVDDQKVEVRAAEP